MASLVAVQQETQAIIEQARRERAGILDLSRRGLMAIPVEVFELVGLERLDLYNNQLCSLPPQIAQLKQLKKLYLSDNVLTTLPPEIGDLADLEYLSVIENPLVALPSELNRLKKLKNIYVDNNDFVGDPAIQGLDDACDGVARSAAVAHQAIPAVFHGVRAPLQRRSDRF